MQSFGSFGFLTSSRYSNSLKRKLDVVARNFFILTIYNLNAPIGNINRGELLFSLGLNCWLYVLFLENCS